MTTLIEAAQQALEALEANQPVNYCMNNNGEKFPMMQEDPFRFERNDQAIAALRQAIEQAEQYPIGDAQAKLIAEQSEQWGASSVRHPDYLAEQKEKNIAMRKMLDQAQKQEHVIDCPRCGHCCPQAAQAQKQERPLDGAAKIFQAMIDALQAGDGYESVLRQFGYAESFEQAQVANNDTSQERVAETAKQEHEQAEKQETVATCKQSLQVQQEPVAWMDEFGNVFPFGAQRGPKYLNEPMKPLYTVPPPLQPEQEQKQEPVVRWICKGCRHEYMKAPSSCDCMEGTEYERVAYYTSPPPRQPLTDEEIEELLPEPDGTAEIDSVRVLVAPGLYGTEYTEADAWKKESVIQVARAIEAAHNIKGEA